MCFDKESVSFVIGDDTSKDNLNIKLRGIVDTVKYQLSLAMQDKETGLINLCPETIISLVVTNILVGLVFAGLFSNSTVNQRLEIINRTLNTVSSMTRNLWYALEAYEANDTVVN